MFEEVKKFIRELIGDLFSKKKVQAETRVLSVKPLQPKLTTVAAESSLTQNTNSSTVLSSQYSSYISNENHEEEKAKYVSRGGEKVVKTKDGVALVVDEEDFETENTYFSDRILQNLQSNPPKPFPPSPLDNIPQPLVRISESSKLVNKGRSVPTLG
jgi:hypothetical protein